MNGITVDEWNALVADNPALQIDTSDPRRQMLDALQRKPMYGGTANPKDVAARRTERRAARKSRRANRRSR